MRKTVIFVLIFTALCFGKKRFTIAVNMIPDELDYFTNEIVAGFNKANKCDLQVMNYTDNARLPGFFDKLPRRKSGQKYPRLGVAMIPHERTRSLIKAGKLRSLNSFLSKEKIEEIKDTYFLVDMFESEAKIFLIPRKLETRMLVYLKDKVKAAQDHWIEMKPDIDEALRDENGAGLPMEYALEASPDLWDFFDLFVVGYYWKHHADNQLKAGRMAHRGKKYHGTVTGLMDRVFQCGGTETAVLDLRMDPAADAFAWECLMIKHGLYNPKIWEQSWSGVDIWTAFKAHETYLAFMTQIDCFFLMGGEKGSAPYVKPENLGVSVMPGGCSIELSDPGAVLRKGRHAVSTGGWWWGIPKKGAKRKLAFKFIEYVTSLEVQKKECGKFGLIPVRMEMMMNSPDFFKSKALQKIFKVSKHQLTNNSINSVPVVKDYNKLEKIYLDIWYDFCLKNYHGRADAPAVQGSAVGKALVKGYNARLQKLQ
jgi:ABC-type glycerol-3-phosphate transport system substrate-binding protein